MLDKRIWRHDPTIAALLAADLVAGFVVFDKLPLQQALRLTGANLRYVQVAMDLSPQERAEVEAGRVTLSSLAQGRRLGAGLEDEPAASNDNGGAL
jgi:hypothetical protein